MQDQSCVAIAPPCGEDTPISAGEVEFLRVEGGWQPRHVEPLLTLGAGRAAQAILVRATDDHGGERLCVEKVFRPGWLTRGIYRGLLQAPFPYQQCDDAVLACYYRRRLAARLTKAMVPQVQVAEPLYVRWDDETRALILGSELAQGRGIRPALADAQKLRRALQQGLADDGSPTPPDETKNLLAVMRRLESLFQECGLIGSGWQVSPAAIVATSNFLRTRSGYTLVDLESGIPAVLVPKYLAAGWRMKSIPLFDDIEPQKMRRFLENHWPRLKGKLGRLGYQQLVRDAEALIRHTSKWKQAEVALGRRRPAFWSAEFQTAYRNRCFDLWRRNEITDQKTDAKLRSSQRLWSRPIYWLGWIPGAPGRFLQRYLGNRERRRDVRRAMLHRSARKELFSSYCERKTDQWQTEGRLSPRKSFRGISYGFLFNWVLSKTTSTCLQACLSDRRRRKTLIARIVLLFVSTRFQREYGQQMIRRMIHQWSAAGRFHAGEQRALEQATENNSIVEYSRGFAGHLSVKLLEPSLLPLKLFGVAFFIATGQAHFLWPLAVSPALRTAITLWRMFLNRRREVAYADALLIGMLPVLGNLAYPVQMYSSHKRLTTFLMRNLAARLGRWFPIYGGRNTRTEMAAIKAADLPLEFLDLLGSASAFVRRWAPQRQARRRADGSKQFAASSRWERFVDEQVALLADSAANHQPMPERIDELIREQKRYRRAA